MREIKIPFQDSFRDAMLNKTKTMTSRTKFYTQNEGDYFNIFGATFVITRLYQMALQYVANDCWRKEGCASPEHFMLVWKRLHPRKGFNPDQMVCCHEFRKISK